MTEGVLTEVPDIREQLPEVKPVYVRPTARYARLAAGAGRTGLVWLALAVVYGSQNPLTDDAVLAITLAAFIWLVALRAASSPDVRLFGRVLSEALGVGLGLVAVVLLNGSSVGMQLSWLGIAGAAVGVMATALAWDWFVDLALAARKRVLFIGSDGLEVMEAEDMDRCRHSGFEIVDTPTGGRSKDGAFSLVGIEELERVVESQRPDIVVLTDEGTFEDALERLLDTRANVRVSSFASFCEYAFGRVPVEQIRPAWFMSLLHPRQRIYTRFSKRTFDILVSLLGLVLTAPVFVVLAVVSKLTPGPILFRQTRVGEGGQHFTIYKFRTMGCDAEQDGPAFSTEDDPRASRVGAALRRTHLDELPQLWNVLRGEMSVVGPRPERPEFIDMIETAVPFWRRRLLVKPGITGWAQVRCGYQSDCDGMARKLSYDLWYLRHRNLLVDLAVCIATFFHVARDTRLKA
jgi:exopolysaccharide biosynthesis polyprenyl glycosylphosphotransferase